MTPLEIEILLHYHCCASDYRDGDFSAPAVREAMDRFVATGLLREVWNLQRSIRYEPTEGCRVFVEALCRAPAPVQKWVIPDRSMTDPAA